MTDNLRRQVALMAALFLLALAVACSGGTKAAPTKSEVTVDPNLYHVDHPELFTLAKVGTQNLPTLLNANGTVTPDVNRNIHVTSQGSGRVVDLRVKLGDTVKKGQVLLTIYSADLTGAFSDYQKPRPTSVCPRRLWSARNCSIPMVRWLRKTWKSLKIPRTKPRWTCRTHNSMSACSAAIRHSPAP